MLLLLHATGCRQPSSAFACPRSSSRWRGGGRRLSRAQGRPRGVAMATAEHQRYLDVAVEAARDAGELIKTAFHKMDKAVQYKGKTNNDLVTETDQECETRIFGRLREAFPDHRFIGEEGSAAQGFTSELTDEPTWMVDPVDGTTNFVHGFPFVCVAIALAEKKEVVAGVVLNPVTGELFTAVRGGGAHLNGMRLHTTATAELGRGLLLTEIGVKRDPDTLAATYGRLQALTPRVRSIRCLGSCALDICQVAAGRADAMFEVGFGGCWDIAAASLIVREAGGDAVDVLGGPLDLMGRRVLCTNGRLAGQVADVIRQFPLTEVESK